MSSHGTWQLVQDAVQEDPDILNRPSSKSRITEVYSLDDGALYFRLRTKHDLDALSTNVQWVRNFRDTVSAGIKAYRVIVKFVKNQTVELKKHNDRAERASIINMIRGSNAEKDTLSQIYRLHQRRYKAAGPSLQ